jgi:hypothetical protein
LDPEVGCGIARETGTQGVIVEANIMTELNNLEWQMAARTGPWSGMSVIGLAGGEDEDLEDDDIFDDEDEEEFDEDDDFLEDEDEEEEDEDEDEDFFEDDEAEEGKESEEEDEEEAD